MHVRGILHLLLLVSVAAAPLTGCSNEAQSQPPEERSEETAIPVEAAVVEAAVVEAGRIDAVLTGTASLEAEEEAAAVVCP